MARTKILYARYECAKDAMGCLVSKGMAIYDSQKSFLGYVPYEHWRVEKIRTIHVYHFQGKGFVKLMPQLKTR